MNAGKIYMENAWEANELFSPDQQTLLIYWVKDTNEDRECFSMKCLDFDFQIDEFLVYCRSTQLRPKTMKSYEQTLRLFQRWCIEQQGLDAVDKISESVIRHYIQDLQERGKYSFYADESQKTTNFPERRRDYRKPVSNTTINNYIRNLRVFFNWLDREDLLKRNPMKKVRQLKASRRAKEYLEDEEMRRLLSKLDRSYFSEHRDYMMTLLMLDTGMRLGECSSLLVDDLELSRRRINLRSEETKGRASRTVFFGEKTERALRRWLQFKDRYTESDYLFPVRESGGHIQVGNFEANFKKYLLRCGLSEEYTPHCLRNNFAKRCLMNGMDIYTLSKLLGHSSVTVTEKAYLDLTQEDIGKRYRNYSPVSLL